MEQKKTIGPGTWLDEYLALAGQFGIMDGNTVQINREIIRRGFPTEERVVALDELTYLADNFPILAGMLAMNLNGFREFVANAITNELNLDELPAKDRTAARARSRGFGSPVSGSVIEIGVTMPTPIICLELYNAVTGRVAALNGSAFAEAVDKKMAAYTKDDKLTVGILLSNFGYILRAVANNGLFRNELKARVADARKTYHV